MISAVLDTNVLASGAIAAAGPPAAVLDAWMRYEFDVVLSDWIIQELARTLLRPYFTDRLTEKDIAEYLSLIRSRALVVDVVSDVPQVATHREDDFVLATAVAGSVDFLVTGDRMVRRLETHGAIRILTPREFLDVLIDAR